jgi:hypothetical protein
MDKVLEYGAFLRKKAYTHFMWYLMVVAKVLHKDVSVDVWSTKCLTSFAFLVSIW